MVASSTSAAPTLEERFERLPLADVVASKTNPRQHFDEAYLKDLADSIGEKGVVQPILVRPNGKRGTFEIVAGECRYRASKLAEQTHIPAVIRTLTDEQALEIQLLENLKRRDLTPLEEARGYRALINSNPTRHSAESIATRIGMSPAWVWDRMKLLDLVPEAKEILDRGLMTTGHAILIARLKPEDQKRVVRIDDGRNGFNNSRDGLWQYQGGALEFETAAEERAHKPDKYEDVKAVSVRELDSWIKDHVRFDIDHAAKAQPLVFEQAAATVKAAAEQPGRGKKVIAITHEYRVADDARDGDERTYGFQSWLRADGKLKSKTCEHSVLGQVVAGRGQGDVFLVCVARDKCLVHFGDVIRRRERNQKLRESGKAKQAAQSERRSREKQEREAREAQEREKAWDALWPHIKAEAKDQISKIKKLTPSQARVIEEADLYYNLRVLLHEELGKTWFKTPAVAWLVVAAAGRDNYESFDEYVTEVAKPLGLDLKRLAAVRDKHQPKPATQTSGVKAGKKAKRAA